MLINNIVNMDPLSVAMVTVLDSYHFLIYFVLMSILLPVHVWSSSSPASWLKCVKYMIFLFLIYVNQGKSWAWWGRLFLLYKIHVCQTSTKGSRGSRNWGHLPRSAAMKVQGNSNSKGDHISWDTLLFVAWQPTSHQWANVAGEDA